MAFLLTLDLLIWMPVVSESKMEICYSGILEIYYKQFYYIFAVKVEK